MPDEVDVVVVGAGQAGLAVSHQLTARDVPHLVLERGRIGQTWRGRWDSFCLVLPNWTLRLPGGAYDGSEPDGFMPRDEIFGFLERYSSSFRAPVREGIEVLSLDRRGASARFSLQTTDGELHARVVVLAAGAYQRPHRPEAAATLPESAHVIDAEGYRHPAALPPGKVLVVGGGQTGCQIAEDLHLAGRDVFLACGRAPWIPRRVQGRDVIGWLIETPFFEQTLADLPNPLARLAGNPQATGRDNGHDLHYRTLDTMGVTLLGHFQGADGNRLHFAGDLAECVAFGDARYADICSLIRRHCDQVGQPQPELPQPEPFVARDPRALDLADFGAIIFTSGFRPDYRSWVRFPDAFDAFGFPLHEDCQSALVPGLFFVGVHFLRKRKSSLLFGVGEDAMVAAQGVADHLRSPSPTG